MKKVQKQAGFWIRILSILIDLIIFLLIAISTSLIALKKENNNLIILSWGYYVWLVLLIVEIIILFIIIPLFLKGRTIGMLSCKISILSLQEDPTLFIVLKKNQLYSFLWIFSILVFMLFISPELAQKMSLISSQGNVEEDKLVLEVWEKALIAIPSTTSGIIIFINILTIFSINMNKNMYGINDKFTNTKLVYTKKWIEIFDKNDKVILKEKRKKHNLIWKD
ncbi:MAG: RDD family protein [Mycoplasmataceae bacterium]|nr:RDD family protein [Mycoplasmataceae bacterium]